MVKIQIELQPFLVPDYVIVKVKPRPRHEGVIESPKYALNELNAETLDLLCREFRAAVFGKAGIEDPAEKRHADVTPARAGGDDGYEGITGHK